MMRWMGEPAGFGGEPDSEEVAERFPTLAARHVGSFGGEAIFEVDLDVGGRPDHEDGWEF